jgi:hypothetical protein
LVGVDLGHHAAAEDRREVRRDRAGGVGGGARRVDRKPGKSEPTICGTVGFSSDENGNWPLSSCGGLEGGLWVTGWPLKVLLQS